MNIRKGVMFILLLIFMAPIQAADITLDKKIITLKKKPGEAFYINVTFPGTGEIKYVFDTGSTYLTVTRQVANSLKKSGHAQFLRESVGQMADGRRRAIQIWNIKTLTIGKDCNLNNVEAAIIPGKSKAIFGLSALEKISPLTVSFQESRVHVTNCH